MTTVFERDKILKEISKDWLDIHQFKEQFEIETVEEYPNNVLLAIPKPMVSVRISTYQHADSIARTIDNILIQEANFPFEIIIGDDESDDGTTDICKEYADKYPNLIRLFLHKRKNNIKILGKPCGIFQVTYNILYARGKYIAGCSGDDYWQDKHKLQKQVEFMEVNSQCSYSYHDWKVVGTGERSSRNKFVLPLTVMMLNVFNKMPAQFVEVLNEDNFFYFILDRLGTCEKMDGVIPSCYSVHENNLWAGEKDLLLKARFKLLVNRKIFEAFRNTRFKIVAQEAYLTELRDKLRVLDDATKMEEYNFLKENGIYQAYQLRTLKEKISKLVKRTKKRVLWK